MFEFWFSYGFCTQCTASFYTSQALFVDSATLQCLGQNSAMTNRSLLLMFIWFPSFLLLNKTIKHTIPGTNTSDLSFLFFKSAVIYLIITCYNKTQQLFTTGHVFYLYEDVMWVRLKANAAESHHGDFDGL